MDVKFIENNYQFLLRTSALIFNKDKDKVLLFKVKDRDFYLLPGGKVERFDSSLNSLKREMKEELGEDYSKINFVFLGISEEFVYDKGLNNHQINIMYKGVYESEISDLVFNGLEGDWVSFEWVDIKDFDDVIIYPSKLKEIVKNPSDIYHVVESLED